MIRHDEETKNRVYGDPRARWLSEAYRITDRRVITGPEQLFAAGSRSIGCLLPAHPATAFFASYSWRRGRGVEVTEVRTEYGRREYRDNPLPLVFEQRRTIRVNLAKVEPQAPILKQLKARAHRLCSLPLCSRPATSMP